MSARDDSLISAAVTPWRIDRDGWKARAEQAEKDRDRAVELLRRRDALIQSEALMAINGFDGIEAHDDALRDWDDDLMDFLAGFPAPTPDPVETTEEP